MSAVVLTAVERELARWEWQEHLAHRPKTDLGVEAATLLVEERSTRSMETGNRSPLRPFRREGIL